MTGTALVVTGGHSHPPDLSAPALTAVLAEAGLTAVFEQDIEAGLRSLISTDPELLVVNALRWTMAHPRYAEFREEWALSLSHEARDAVEAWVGDGGALLALHTALVCFDDWPGWGDLLGGSWDWDRSRHPDCGPVQVECSAEHSITAGVAPFTVEDECYVDLALRPGIEVVATMTVPGEDSQPAVWVRREGGGRVAVSTLGHDLRSLDEPGHRALLGRLVRWLLAGEGIDDTGGTA